MLPRQLASGLSLRFDRPILQSGIINGKQELEKNSQDQTKSNTPNLVQVTITQNLVQISTWLNLTPSYVVLNAIHVTCFKRGGHCFESVIEMLNLCWTIRDSCLLVVDPKTDERMKAMQHKGIHHQFPQINQGLHYFGLFFSCQFPSQG